MKKHIHELESLAEDLQKKAEKMASNRIDKQELMICFKEWRKGLLIKGPGEEVSRGRVTDRLAIPTLTHGPRLVKRISELIDLASSCFIPKQKKRSKGGRRNFFPPKPLTFLESPSSVLLRFVGMEKRI